MKPPKFASWESTLGCNMQCAHCGLSASPLAIGSRGKELSTGEAEKMFDDLLSLGVANLVLSGGEFTTRSDWKHLLALAIKKFSTVRQISNGWLGSGLVDAVESIGSLERYVLSLSLDGLGKTHDDNRRNRSFERVADILKADSLIFKTVITTVTNRNFSELDDIFGFLAGLPVSAWMIQLGLPEGRMKMENFIGKEMVRILSNKILDWQKKSFGAMEVIPDDCFGYAHPMRDIIPWKGCHAGKDLITILSNGDVTGCPTMFMNVCGNIRENKLSDIWNGDKMNDFRINLPKCDVCDGKVCGGGCRAVDHVFGKQFCF